MTIEPALEHVADFAVLVAAPVEIGTTAAGARRIIAITGGTVSGPQLFVASAARFPDRVALRVYRVR